MPPDPITSKPNCDVFGCGHLSTHSTDGSESDSHPDAKTLNRKSIAKINLCDHHSNWAHSEDAVAFSVTDAYRKRA
jgi:hypothetical protein